MLVCWIQMCCHHIMRCNELHYTFVGLFMIAHLETQAHLVYFLCQKHSYNFLFSLHLLHFDSHCPLTSQLGPINKSHMNSQVACLLDGFGNQASCKVKFRQPGTEGNKSTTSKSKRVGLLCFNSAPDKQAKVEG